VDKLLDEADSTADVKVRKAKLEEVTKILYQDYAIIPIYQYEEPYGLVKGLDFTPRVDAFIFDVNTMQKK
jgi:ABC-type transport system substrate-binding protein